MNLFIQPGQFSDQELPIASKIQQRRLQMLVHSYIYYKLDENIISDHAFNYWGHELANLQNKHPDIASRVCYAEAFKDWTGDTGAFLPLDDPWVINKAYQLLGRGVEDEHKKILKASGENSGQKPKRQSTSKQRRSPLFMMKGNKMTNNKKSTRYYSGRQEKRVAKKLGGKMQTNSGAAIFAAGDVLCSKFLIECKTATKEKASMSIKADWIDKLKEEAFAMNKEHWALAFNFGGLSTTENFYIIDENLFRRLAELLEEE